VRRIIVGTISAWMTQPGETSSYNDPTLGTITARITSDLRDGVTVGFWSNQIPLKLNLRKDRETKFLFLLKLGFKICQMITESYTHFNPLQNIVKYYFTSNLSERLKRYIG
jgi:uncharacterized membrane protein